MINGDDPPPLDDPASQSPESLVRALRALGREQPSVAALRATGQRLQARLDGPPVVAPPPSLGASVQTSGTTTLLAGRLIMAAVTAVVGVGALVFFQQRTPESAPSRETAAQLPADPVASQAPPIRVPAPGLEAPAASKATPATRVPSTVHAASLTRKPAETSAPTAKVAVPRRMRAQPTSPAPERSDGQSSVSRERTSAAVDESATTPALAIAPTQRAQRPSSASRAPEPSHPPAPTGELALLLEARKRAHKDPEATLHLTAEHARRFPHGVLAPEREVLAIEALRALGLPEQAEKRVRDFRAAYPDSLHIRALTSEPTH